MLEQVLTNLNNWFLLPDGIYDGTYSIQGGCVDLPFLQSGQYFRIIGSVFNDGLYIYSSSGMLLDEYGVETYLTDETFTGAIWALAVPKAVVSLAKEIDAWQEKYKDVITAPYTSESFGGYAYTKSSIGSSDASVSGWQDAFRTRLNPYRKIHEVGFVKPTIRSHPLTPGYFGR